MKLAFEKADLLKSLNIVTKAVSQKAILPILKCVLIDASKENERVTLFANDNEIAIRTIVAGEVYEDGKIAVDAKLFTEMVKKFEDDVITFETDENFTAKVTCGKAKFTIPGLDGEGFPPIPNVKFDGMVTISQYGLKEMIRQTAFSLDIGNANKMMTGELFEVKDDCFRLCALDGHRVAIRKMLFEKDEAAKCKPRKEIIPGRSLNEVSKILSDNYDDTVSVYFSTTHSAFMLGSTVLYTRLIDGEYFALDRMFKYDPTIKVVVDKKEFNGCIERAGLLVREGENKPIILDISDERMDVSVNTSVGNMHDSLPVDKSGDDIRIGFNPRFLTDVVKAVDDEYLTLYMVNQKSPCFIQNDDETYLYLILPVAIS